MARSQGVIVLEENRVPWFSNFLSISILSVIDFSPLRYNQQNACINLCWEENQDFQVCAYLIMFEKHSSHHQRLSVEKFLFS